MPTRELKLPEDRRKAMGGRLRETLGRRSKTPADLARHLRCSDENVSKMVQGAGSLAGWILTAEFLNESLDYLVWGITTRNAAPPDYRRELAELRREIQEIKTPKDPKH